MRSPAVALADMFRQEKHSPVSDSEDAESLLPLSNEQLEIYPQNQARRARSWCSIALLVLSHFLVLCGGAYLGSHWRTGVDGLCALYTNRFSPVVKYVDIKYSPVLYNGSFFHQTKYRGDAGPEVDAAWEALGIDCELTWLFPVKYQSNHEI
jgi:hypothetical protein